AVARRSPATSTPSANLKLRIVVACVGISDCELRIADCGLPASEVCGASPWWRRIAAKSVGPPGVSAAAGMEKGAVIRRQNQFAIRNPQSAIATSLSGALAIAPGLVGVHAAHALKNALGIRLLNVGRF